MATLKGVHIAITLRGEESMPPRFKETNILSKDEGFLWGYYGEYAHTHLGLGHGDFFKGSRKTTTQKEWKTMWHEERMAENAESLAEKAYIRNHPELNP